MCDQVKKACCDIEHYIALHTSATPDSVTPALSVVPSLHMRLKLPVKVQKT